MFYFTGKIISFLLTQYTGARNYKFRNYKYIYNKPGNDEEIPLRQPMDLDAPPPQNLIEPN
uniref:hypothetical protein n=1 Tax=uncultured Draconibacterium sp. TaxID=1573823 RepID=UPI0032165CBA